MPDTGWNERARRWRIRASTLLAIAFLASATAAFAESWVMWSETQNLTRLGSESKWSLADAFPSYEECVRETRVRIEDLRSEYQKTAGQGMQVGGSGNTIGITFAGPPPEMLAFTLKCWPATIDPRGPKGK
jgi:hypothetical protein